MLIMTVSLNLFKKLLLTYYQVFFTIQRFESDAKEQLKLNSPYGINSFRLSLDSIYLHKTDLCISKISLMRTWMKN